MSRYTRLRRETRDLSNIFDELKPLAKAVNERNYDDALQFIRGKTYDESAKKQVDCIYNNKSGKEYSLMEMQNVILAENGRSSGFRSILGMFFAAAVFAGSFYLFGHLNNSCVDSKSCNTAAVQKQTNVYVMQKGDCPWTVLKRMNPRYSDADLVNMINKDISRLNNRGTIGEDAKGTGKKSIDYWQIGEKMVMP